MASTTFAPIISVRDSNESYPTGKSLTATIKTKPSVQHSAKVSHPSIAPVYPKGPSWVSRARSASWNAIRKTAASARFQSGFAYSLIALLVFGFVANIIFINSSAAKGYEIKKIQNRIQQETDIHHSLEIKTAELSSLGVVDQTVQDAGLVSVTNEEFLTPQQITALRTTK